MGIRIYFSKNTNGTAEWQYRFLCLYAALRHKTAACICIQAAVFFMLSANDA